jgi:hypothetical protein
MALNSFSVIFRLVAKLAEGITRQLNGLVGGHVVLTNVAFQMLPILISHLVVIIRTAKASYIAIYKSKPIIIG